MIIKVLGYANKENEPRFYDTLKSFIVKRGRDKFSNIFYEKYDLLLSNNYITQEFLDFKGPKVFNCWEPILCDKVYDIKDLVMFLYTDKDINHRWFYPSIPENREKLLKQLKESLKKTRQKMCCMVNRYAEIRNTKNDLIKNRMEYCLFFGKKIDIYGNNNWASILKNHHRYSSVANQFLGSCEKLKKIKEYTFNLCFENTDINGYITEKLIEAIKCGCVPLYFGGGAFLEESVPKTCYINCKGIDPELCFEIINKMSFDDIVEYRENAISFLESKQADFFTRRRWIRQILYRWNKQIKGF